MGDPIVNLERAQKLKLICLQTTVQGDLNPVKQREADAPHTAWISRAAIC